MSVQTSIPSEEPVIVMSRVFDAPRRLVWAAMTEPRHVLIWWGGEGVTNPVCEMDVRPGGRWRHVMRFPDGHELPMEFVFVEVEEPEKLVWRSVRESVPGGPPNATISVTLSEAGEGTAWRMVSRFASFEDREAALGVGFTGPIERSSNGLAEYLKRLQVGATV